MRKTAETAHTAVVEEEVGVYSRSWLLVVHVSGLYTWGAEGRKMTQQMAMW